MGQGSQRRRGRIEQRAAAGGSPADRRRKAPRCSRVLGAKKRCREGKEEFEDYLGEVTGDGECRVEVDDGQRRTAMKGLAGELQTGEAKGKTGQGPVQEGKGVPRKMSRGLPKQDWRRGGLAAGSGGREG